MPDCEDSISYAFRSVTIALRSPTELLYSALGDLALATTLTNARRKGFLLHTGFAQ